jgi:hypothetical protein
MVQISVLRRAFGEEPGRKRWIARLSVRGAISIEDRGSIADSSPVADFPSPAGATRFRVSGDSEQEYFADGMMEKIGQALATG